MPDPAEQELERLLAVVAERSRALADLNAEVARLQALFARFSSEFAAHVSPVRREIDSVQALLTQERKRLQFMRDGIIPTEDPPDAEDPENPDGDKSGDPNWEDATEERLPAGPHSRNSAPTLRRLYRELARRIHPDLAQNPEERTERERIMAVVNNAYREGDLARLHAIYNETAAAGEPGSRSIVVRFAAARDEIALLDRLIGERRRELVRYHASPSYDLWSDPERIPPAIRKMKEEAAALLKRMGDRLEALQAMRARLERKAAQTTSSRS